MWAIHQRHDIAKMKTAHINDESFSYLKGDIMGCPFLSLVYLKLLMSSTNTYFYKVRHSVNGVLEKYRLTLGDVITTAMR